MTSEGLREFLLDRPPTGLVEPGDDGNGRVIGSDVALCRLGPA